MLIFHEYYECICCKHAEHYNAWIMLQIMHWGPSEMTGLYYYFYIYGHNDALL